MSRIYLFEGFDDKTYELSKKEGEEAVFQCMVKDKIDKDMLDRCDQGYILENGEEVGLIGLIEEQMKSEEIDANTLELTDEILTKLDKLSETEGNLISKFEESDPVLFGYLGYIEVKELKDLLGQMENKTEEQDLVINILDKLEQEKLGLIYYALP